MLAFLQYQAVVTGSFQDSAAIIQHFRFIIDDQYFFFMSSHDGSLLNSGAFGKVMVKVVPFLISLSTPMEPLCSMTMAWVMGSPNPVPFPNLFCGKERIVDLVKMLLRHAGSGIRNDDLNRFFFRRC